VAFLFTIESYALPIETVFGSVSGSVAGIFIFSLLPILPSREHSAVDTGHRTLALSSP